MTLVRRAQGRGIPAEVASVSRGDPLPARSDLVFIGGGSDRVQHAVGSDFLGRRHSLEDVVAAGGVVVGVCGGYQMLGRGYRPRDGGLIEGLGLLDVTTEAGDGRLVGRVKARTSLDGRATTLIGFENHAGRTWVGRDAAPLASVPRGRGNNGFDRTEGAVAGSVIGTYLHGPVLVLNPALADHLLALALGRSDLPPLDDRAESRARSAWPGPRRRLRLRRS
jgi:CobQ-like glutamine amidotransferase family enzyme